MHQHPLGQPGMMGPGGLPMGGMPPMMMQAHSGMTGVADQMQRPEKRPWQPDTTAPPQNLAEPASKQAALQRAAQVAAQVASAPPALVGRGLHRVVPAWMVKATAEKAKKEAEQAQAQQAGMHTEDRPGGSAAATASSLGAETAAPPAQPAVHTSTAPAHGTPSLPAPTPHPARTASPSQPPNAHRGSAMFGSYTPAAHAHRPREASPPAGPASDPYNSGPPPASYNSHPRQPAQQQWTSSDGLAAAAPASAWGAGVSHPASPQHSNPPRGRSLLGKAPPSLLGRAPPAAPVPPRPAGAHMGFPAPPPQPPNHAPPGYYHLGSPPSATPGQLSGGVAPSASSTYALADLMTGGSGGGAAPADAEGDGWGAPETASIAEMGWGAAPRLAAPVPATRAPATAPPAASTLATSSAGHASPSPRAKSLALDDKGRPVVRLAAGSNASAPSPKVVFHPVSKPSSGPESAAFRAVVFPKDGAFVAAARAHLDKIGVWWPQREGRRHFWVYPVSESERPAYKGLLRDLADRDRALVIPAGDGVHVFHVIPPTPEMIRKKVVPSQHRTHLTVVYGRETKR